MFFYLTNKAPFLLFPIVHSDTFTFTFTSTSTFTSTRFSRMASLSDVWTSPCTRSIDVISFNANGRPPPDYRRWVRLQRTKVVGEWSVSNPDPDKDASKDAFKDAAKDMTIPSLRPPSPPSHPHHPPPDIIVLALQERVPYTASTLFFRTQYGPALDDTAQLWIDTMMQTFDHWYGKKHSYRVLTSRHMVGIQLTIFVRKKNHGIESGIKNVHNTTNNHIDKAIHDVRTASVGVGTMDAGNKGAVACIMRIDDTVVGIISAHLAAHQHNVEQRNSDWANICRRLSFEPITTTNTNPLTTNMKYDQNLSPSPSPSSSSSSSSSTTSTTSTTMKIEDCDTIIVAADANYRVDATAEQLEACRRSGDWQSVWMNEQLTRERTNGRVFHGFNEANITFAPTYKFRVGTDEYDDKRLMAWCDRILYRGEVSCEAYTSCMEVKCSDHKPVYCSLKVVTRRILHERKAAMRLQLLREIDSDENKRRPLVELAQSDIDYEYVRYGRIKSREVHLKNIGECAAQFQFVSAIEGQPIAPSWLSVHPSTAILLPNESCSIVIMVRVQQEAQTLMQLKMDLDHILVLRITDGRDFFICVHGVYVRSCIGCSLEWLTNFKGPIRDAAACMPISPPLHVPQQVTALVDYLRMESVNVDNLFEDVVSTQDIDAIIDALDTNSQLPRHQPHAAAQALLQMLAALPEPIFSDALLQQCTELVMQRHLMSWCSFVITRLRHAHQQTFQLVLQFLRSWIAQTKSADYARLMAVLVFAPVLMPTAMNIPSGFDDVFGSNDNVTQQKPKAWVIMSMFLSDEFSL